MRSEGKEANAPRTGLLRRKISSTDLNEKSLLQINIMSCIMNLSRTLNEV